MTKIYKLKILTNNLVLKLAQKWQIRSPRITSKQSHSTMLAVTLPSWTTADNISSVATSKSFKVKRTVIAFSKVIRHLVPKTTTPPIKMSSKIYKITAWITKISIESIWHVNSHSWSLEFKICRWTLLYSSSMNKPITNCSKKN